MKKYFFFLLVSSFIIACGPSKKEQELQARLDSIQAQTDLKDEAMNDFMATINAVEENLAQIKETESIITLTANEGGDNVAERINEDINTVYALMQENQDKVDALEKKLKDSNYHGAKMKKTIESLKKRIEEQTMQIAKMQKQLKQKNIVIEGLNDDITRLAGNLDTLKKKTAMQKERIAEQKMALNTAYYVTGTKKELKNNGVIEREGGVLGLGKTSSLSSSINTDYFTKINIKEVTKIPVFSKKAEVVTRHPAGTYSFEGEDPIENLVISDPEKFWSTSKYLVIEVK